MSGQAGTMETRQLERVREAMRCEFSKVRQKLRTAITDASDALDMMDSTEAEALNACRREDMLPESSAALAIYRLTATHLGLPPERISPASRNVLQVTVRHLAMWLYGDTFPTATLSAAGRAFERHHTTVYHARRRVEQRRATDPEYAALVEDLRAALRNGGGCGGKNKQAGTRLAEGVSMTQTQSMA